MKKLILIAVLYTLGCWFVGVATAQPPYSNADFNGSYAFGVAGSVVSTPPSPPTPPCSGWITLDPPLALATTGTLVANGTGGLTGTQTFNAGGLVCSGTLVGTYTVSADGTGKLLNVVFTPADGSPPQCSTTVGNSAFTFSNGINRLDLTGTDCFQVTSGSATKQ
jgi:hypothetical protein